VLTIRLLRALSLPNLRAHPARTLVTIVGVALGVAAFVGIASINRAVVASFANTLETIAGDAELEVDPAAGTLAEATAGTTAATSRAERSALARRSVCARARRPSATARRPSSPPGSRPSTASF
jgi:hypothetical protein